MEVILSEKVSIGFPAMRVESGEKRVFLPDFIGKLSQIGFKVAIEKGYGSSLNFSFEDYKKSGIQGNEVDRKEAFRQDIVLILRSPSGVELRMMKENTCLISMLHYPTHPLRLNMLKAKGINAISLDSIVDDFGVRLVENMRSVAWNGLEAAFSQFVDCDPNLLPFA